MGILDLPSSERERFFSKRFETSVKWRALIRGPVSKNQEKRAYFKDRKLTAVVELQTRLSGGVVGGGKRQDTLATELSKRPQLVGGGAILAAGTGRRGLQRAEREPKDGNREKHFSRSWSRGKTYDLTQRASERESQHRLLGENSGWGGRGAGRRDNSIVSSGTSHKVSRGKDDG